MLIIKKNLNQGHEITESHKVSMSTKDKLRSKCHGAKLLELNRKYYSPCRLARWQPKCSKCRKPCEVEEKEEGK